MRVYVNKKHVETLELIIESVNPETGYWNYCGVASYNGKTVGGATGVAYPCGYPVSKDRNKCPKHGVVAPERRLVVSDLFKPMNEELAARRLFRWDTNSGVTPDSEIALRHAAYIKFPTSPSPSSLKRKASVLEADVDDGDVGVNDNDNDNDDTTTVIEQPRKKVATTTTTAVRSRKQRLLDELADRCDIVEGVLEDTVVYLQSQIGYHQQRVLLLQSKVKEIMEIVNDENK